MIRIYVPVFLAVATAACAGASENIAAKGSIGWSKTKPDAGRFVETPQGFMVPYSLRIPGTDVELEMVPVPGGTFLAGSPNEEAGRSKDEGPQFEVVVEPFWIGKHEVTWAQYQPYMDLYTAFKDLEGKRNLLRDDGPSQSGGRQRLVESLKKYEKLERWLESTSADVDAITCPTPLYYPDVTFEFGDGPRLPAISMTQFAAKHYTKWLSKTTGGFMRLPTEAEWEYACRAGSKTAYNFGDDSQQLGDYAWFAENSDDELHEVGSKKPNAWGIHDMHGSVAEWVLDAHVADGYAKLQGKRVPSADAVAWPTEEYPRVVKGGHWNAEAKQCRCASRLGSHEDWKKSDPNLPKSPWWFTNQPAFGVGFRIVRPLGIPTLEELAKVWEADVDDIRSDVASRLNGGLGPGAQESVGLEFPKIIKQLNELNGKQ